MDPIESINDSCRKMKKLSQAIQAARGNSSTDVSDIFDISSSILTTIIKKATNSDEDPNQKLLEAEKMINNILNAKHQQFISKMESLFSQTADRVNYLNEISKKLKQNATFIIDNNSPIQENVLNRLEKEQIKTFSELHKKFTEAEDLKKQEQQFAYENLESYLSQVNKDISNRYIEQLEQFDQIINAHEVKLQQVVHDKHVEIQKKALIMEDEEKRYLSEVERISTEQQQIRLQYEEKIAEMKLMIEKLKYEIGQKQLSNQDLLDKYEADLIALHEYQKNEYQEKLKQLTSEIESLLAQKRQVEHKKKQTKIQCESLLSEHNREYDLKIKELENDVHSKSVILNEEIQLSFQPKIDSMNSEIEKYRSQKNEQMQRLKKEHDQNDLILEDDARKLKEKSEKELLVVDKSLKEKKLQLKQIQDERNDDLTKLKNEKMQILAGVMQEKDEKTRLRSETMNGVLKKLMTAQKELFEKHFFPSEKMNVHQGIIMERIQKAGFESTDFYELDDDFRKLKKEFLDHDEKLNLIRNQIDTIYENIDSLKSKLDSIEKSRIQLLEKYIGSKDESLLLDLETVSKFGSENSDVQNLFGRLVTLSTIVNLKTESLLNEVDQLSHSMAIEKDKFERNLNEITNHFDNSETLLDNQHNSLTEKYDTIQNTLLNQKKLIESQDKEIDQKAIEIETFENNFEDSKQEYESQNREMMKQTAIDLEQKSISLQHEIEEVQSHFEEQLNSLKQKLEIAKGLTFLIRESSLQSREIQKNEESIRMQRNFERKEQELNDNHQKKIVQINSDRRSYEQQKSQERFQLNETFKLQINSYLKDFHSQLNDLKTENSLALTEGQKLAHELEILQTCPCQKCEQKKEMLRRLLDKKKEIEKKIEMHHELAKQNDQNISVMMGFKKTQQGVATPLLELQAKQQHGPMIAKPSRAKTSLAFK